MIGTPYDRASTHCWWLAAAVQADVFGRAMPAGPKLCPERHERIRLLANPEERARWQQVEAAQDGDMVLMARMPGRDDHCGVYLADRGGVIHTDERHGAVVDTIIELEQVRRWRLTFYRPIAPT